MSPSNPLMKCGCVALCMNSTKPGVLAPGIPACPIHDCWEVDLLPPSLDGRLARCTYYNRGSFRNYECNYRKLTGCTAIRCLCELPSSFELAFFHYAADKNVDEFYCGCAGWD